MTISRNLVFFLVMFFPIHSSCQTEKENFKKGLDILKSSGAEAAIDYFSNTVLETDSFSALYGLAWSLWSNGDIKQSEIVASFVLKNASTPKLQANCHYLMGFTKLHRGKNEMAEQHFQTASELYRQEGSKTNLFRALCGIATVRLNQKEFLQAEEILNDAENLFFQNDEHVGNPKIPPLGFFYQLKSNVYLGLTDYQKALSMAERSYSEFKANDDNYSAVQIRPTIGFLKILNGDIDGGIAETRRVDEIIYSTKSEYRVLSYYNALNWILIYRCSGEPFEDMVAEIKAYNQEEKDIRLMELLEFVLAWPCQ